MALIGKKRTDNANIADRLHADIVHAETVRLTRAIFCSPVAALPVSGN